MRAAPDDLREQHARLHSASALRLHYGAHPRTVRRWLADLGLSALQPCLHVPRVAPPEFIVLAKRRPLYHLRRELKASHATLVSWYGAAGVQRLARTAKRRQPCEVDPITAALSFLRQHVGQAFDGGPHYELVTGKRFIVERHRLNSAELVQFAERHGWQG